MSNRTDGKSRLLNVSFELAAAAAPPPPAQCLLLISMTKYEQKCIIFDVEETEREGERERERGRKIKLVWLEAGGSESKLGRL